MGYQTFAWADVRERLKDRTERKIFWTDSEALIAFNEALKVWNFLTGYWHDRAITFTQANVFMYTLSANLLYRTRITWNNLPLTPSNRFDFNQRANWRSETTLSGGDVPGRPMFWAPISLTVIYIWPQDAVAGNVLTFDGISATPVLSTDTGTVNLGEELFTTLLGYALHVLSFKKGGPAFQSTMPLFQTFLTEAAEENDQIKNSSVYKRVMGLDDRSLKPHRGEATLLDPLVGRTP